MPPTAEPVRIIQVGAGAMGRAWLQVIADSDQVELVGLVDLNTDAARQAADQTGFPSVAVAGSLDELFDRVDAQAVLNVTIPAAHASVSTTALRHGLPVLCEKPLAETVSTGLSMIAAAELSGQLLMVSQSRRYWRNLSAYRQQIAQLGPIGTVDCSFFKAPHFGGFRDEMPFPLLIDMAIHQFDLARDLIGAEPVAVYCSSYNPGGAGSPATQPPRCSSSSPAEAASVSTAVGAVREWRRPGTEPGASAVNEAAPSGTVTTSRRRRTPTAGRSPPASVTSPNRSPGHWPSSWPFWEPIPFHRVRHTATC